MTKFKIIETQIDNYNETNNQLQKFDEGLNIICGPNEAGKSTLMEFVKNIFIRKSADAKGYVKCEYNDESFNLLAGETKKLKENEKYLRGITAHDFQTGFIINIDDIMFAKKANAEELLNTIKDSSGNAVNIKQEEYYNYIYDSKKQDYALTKRGYSTSFKKQFDRLNDIDKKIKELQAKESDYNNICQSIEMIEKELNLLSEKVECAEIIIQKNEAIGEKAKLTINPKVLEFKSEFDKLREEFGALNSIKRSEEDLNKKIVLNKEKFREKFDILDRLNDGNITNFEEYKLENEDLKFGRKLVEEETRLLYEQKNIQTKIDELLEQIEVLNNSIKSSDENRNKLNMYDINEYVSDKNLLTSYLERCSDLQNKMRTNSSLSQNQRKWYEDMFITLFAVLALGMIGGLISYWNSSVRYVLISMLLVSIVGINTVFMQRISAKKNNKIGSYDDEFNQCVQSVIKLCKKYGCDVKYDSNFVVVVNSFLKSMDTSITEYENIDKELLRIRIDLDKSKTKLDDNETLYENISQNLEELSKTKTGFLERIKLTSLENLEEIYELVKELKSLQNVISDAKKELEFLEKNTENFTNKLNEFIEKTGLNDFQKYNKYDYQKFDEILDKIDKIVCENIANEKMSKDIDEKITKYDEKISEYSDFELTNINDEYLQELKHKVKLKTEEKARLSQQKDDLENVSGLYRLRNEKNIELNKIKEFLIKLIQKEIIYDVICNAKEKFNEIQPNFISAKEYFTKITNGKYSEIDFENKTISGVDTGDKDWDNLSRGTKEQLYLALRLGYANNYSKDSEGNSNGKPDLPVIVDDAFVNFDKNRTAAILRCLSDFAKTNQVLFFTCHTDSIKEILKKEKIKYNCIEL